MPEPLACPICGALLKEGDQLLSYYYHPKRWMVIHHVVAAPGNEYTLKIPMGNDLPDAVLTIPNTKSFCGSANYNVPNLR